MMIAVCNQSLKQPHTIHMPVVGLILLLF